MRMNRLQVGSMFGTGTTQIDRFVNEGMPFISRPISGKGTWEFDSKSCIDWYVNRERGRNAKSNPLKDAELRTAVADATLREVRAALALESVITVEDAVAVQEEQYAIIKSRVNALPGRLAVPCAAESDPAKVLNLVKAEVAEVLAGISGKKDEPESGGGTPAPAAPPAPIFDPVADAEDPYDGY